MKREKRHGIERELSIKRIRSQKKYTDSDWFSDVGRIESRICRES